MRLAKGVVFALNLIPLGACGRPTPRTSTLPTPAPVPPTSAATQHTVMVIDDGFDPSAAIFAGKLVAQYTLSCTDDGLSVAPSTSFSDNKAKVLTQLATADTSCTLTSGITPKISDAFTTITNVRTDWNRYWDSKGTDQGARATLQTEAPDTIESIVSGSDISYHYHGTATAGLIAYENPNVQLVLVETTLGDAGKSAPQGCPDAATFARRLALLSDTDIQAAYTDQPLATDEAGLSDLITKHHVSLINKSFGKSARGEMSNELAKLGCSGLDLASLYRAEGVIASQRAAFLTAANQAIVTAALTLQAAGNDSQRIDSADDMAACGYRGHNTLFIGALDADRSLASFSNYGNCVDAYTLGNDVLLAAPRDFLTVESGTSFSTPMTVRYLSMTTPAEATPSAMAAKLRADLDGAKALPQAAVPEALSYDDQSVFLQGYALIDQAGAPAASSAGHLKFAARPVKALPTPPRDL